MEKIKNTIVNNVAQCKIIWYAWVESEISVQNDSTLKGNLKENLDRLSDSFNIDLSNHLVDSVTFSKSLDSPTGSFSFNLDNSRDWKDIIKPGEWCVILMTQNGDLRLPEENSSQGNPIGLIGLPSGPKDLSSVRQNIRGLCYIDRVSVQTAAEGNGEFNVTYEVSGRDFGVVYENTDIWFNDFTFDASNVNTLNQQIKNSTFKDIGEVIKMFHELFLAPEKRIPSKAGSGEGVTPIPKQWLLPKQLVNDLKLSCDDASYYGNVSGLTNTFERSPCAMPIGNPMSMINGNLWSKLKAASVQEFHELFTELNDAGKPRLFFRPIPWGIDQRGYPTLSKFIPTYLDYANSTAFRKAGFNQNSVNLDASDVLTTDIGEDNHNRYNNYLMNISAAQNGAFTTIGVLIGNPSPAGRQFPFSEEASIRRHGFKAMHVQMDSLSASLSTVNEESSGPAVTANKNGSPTNTLVIEYQEVLRDYWNNAVFFESGGMAIMGRPDIKVGKVLRTPDDLPYHQNKLFYIESYTDEFSIQDNGATQWTQKLQLTRGIEEDDLIAASKLDAGALNNIEFGSRSFLNDFTKSGSFVSNNTNKGNKD